MVRPLLLYRTLGLIAGLFAAAASAAKSPSTYFSGNAAEMKDYLDWLDTTNYQGSLYLGSDGDPQDGAAIHWNIDEEGEMLELAVAARATGWLGFGLSENGGMSGSDMLIFEAANPTTVKDAYVTTDRYPELDSCQSWEFVNSVTDSEQFLIVEVKRRLDTGDSQDWPIVNDESIEVALPRIIAAWGESGSVGFHGARNARSTIRWYGFGKDEIVEFQATMDAKASGSFRLDQQDYNLPSNVTTYESYCITADDMRAQNVPLDDGITLIGFEPIITSPYVHHYTMYASLNENNNATCDFSAGYMDLLYVWAPGEPPMIMPDNVGISVGGATGFRSFRIEYHYDNKEQRSDLFDSSGLKFHYSLEPPEQEAGMMQIGDPFISLYNTPVGEGLAEHVFECPSGCTETFLADGSVTVFREILHMHESGSSMFSEHYRDGEIIRTAKAEYFDFEQQGGQNVIQAPYELKAGDSFRTGCFYSNDNNERIFGLASSEEMCISFMMYYPRKNLQGAPFYCGVGLSQAGLPQVCDATHEKVETAVAERSLQDERFFGESLESCPTSAVAPGSSSVESLASDATTSYALGSVLSVIIISVFGMVFVIG